jgi:aminomethyltransferase
MLKTPLYDRHIALGAKMADFAGYLMPIQYSGIMQEHRAVRTTAGLFDVSHMGEFIVSEAGGEAFLNRVTINDVRQIQPWQAQYSAMCNEEGGIIDDLIIYRFPESFLLVVNAANIEKDFQWLKSHKPPGVTLRNDSDRFALIALQGPSSRAILSRLVNESLDDLKFYWFRNAVLQGVELTLARTGYTGELGYELYIPGEQAEKIWDSLMEAGQEEGLIPVGLGCRDTLRLEMKYCLYGNDIDENTNPIEAGLGWITKLEKGPFIGRESLLKAKNNLTRKLVCLEMVERAIPRKGYSIFQGDSEVGFVTSGTQSPSLNKGIALGYVDLEWARRGTELAIEIRGKRYRCIIVKPPFYKDGTAHI